MTNHPPVANQQCSSACLDESALIAAADGDASSQAQDHLRACAACAARENTYADLQAQLRRRLYRLFCPSSEELAACHAGTLEPKHAAALAGHIATCPHCTREAQVLHQLLGPPQKPPAQRTARDG